VVLIKTDSKVIDFTTIRKKISKTFRCCFRNLIINKSFINFYFKINTMINIRPDEISSIIREQIEKYDQDVKVDNIGTVLQVGDVLEFMALTK
jgi:hypothetical protein